jgi:hypothetical protein
MFFSNRKTARADAGAEDGRLISAAVVEERGEEEVVMASGWGCD